MCILCAIYVFYPNKSCADTDTTLFYPPQPRYVCMNISLRESKHLIIHVADYGGNISLIRKLYIIKVTPPSPPVSSKMSPNFCILSIRGINKIGLAPGPHLRHLVSQVLNIFIPCRILNLQCFESDQISWDF